MVQPPRGDLLIDFVEERRRKEKKRKAGGLDSTVKNCAIAAEIHSDISPYLYYINMFPR